MSLVERLQNFAYWRARRLIHGSRYLLDNLEGYLALYEMTRNPRDPRIRYPCYRSFDELIDVDRLRGLHERLERQVLETVARSPLEPFDTGNTKLRLFGKRYADSRVIPLTSTGREFQYFDLDRPELWHPTDHVEDFPELWDFVQTLPFRKLSRVVLFVDPMGRAVPVHRDHSYVDKLHEFVWFRTNLDGKPFFLMDRPRGKRCYIEGYSAWFDTVNQLHGGEANGALSISIRADGEFTEELRSNFVVPDTNPASASALWAALASAEGQPHSAPES